MKGLVKIIVPILIMLSLFSCGNDHKTRRMQYMPDMYRPVPYEVYSTNPNFKDGLSSQQPVAGTVARGQVPYDYPNTEEGYQDAKANLVSNLKPEDIDLEKGKHLYNIYCSSCHSKNGDGNGVLSQRDKFPGIPNYNSRDITDGSIYHVIMHGRNMMGSHASQLNSKERWQVVHYVQKLKKDLTK
ncbi:MAG: cytochrome c [Flavobacteriaceae bacterium]